MRAQSSLELLVVFGVMLFLFSAIVQQFYLKTGEAGRRAGQNELRGLCSEIARAVLAAKISGNGYHEHVEFAPANLSFFPDVRVLDIDRKETCYLPTAWIIVESVGEDGITVYNVNGSVVIA